MENAVLELPSAQIQLGQAVVRRAPECAARRNALQGLGDVDQGLEGSRPQLGRYVDILREVNGIRHAKLFAMSGQSRNAPGGVVLVSCRTAGRAVLRVSGMRERVKNGGSRSERKPPLATPQGRRRPCGCTFTPARWVAGTQTKNAAVPIVEYDPFATHAAEELAGLQRLGEVLVRGDGRRVHARQRSSAL